MNKIVLRNGFVYKKEGIVKADLLISEGKLFLQFSKMDEEGATVYDVDGKLIVPGFVDVHVHLREPGFSYKETIKSGCRAAAHGGYTAVCAMPNLNPPPSNIENLTLEMDKIHEDACIAVYPYGSLTKNQSGRGELSDIAELAPYVIGFTDDGKGMQDDWLMLEAMVQAKSVGKAVIAHCEDERELNPGACIHEGMFAEAHGYIGINSASEWKQVERDIHLTEESGAQYHICHVSTKESVALIQKAKEKGLPVSGETGPHYLMFTDEDLQEDGSWKMNPPIRSMEDRAALIKGIQEGVLDCLITDHAPHSVEEKSKGLDGSSFGIVGLETAFASMLHNMVLRNPLDQDPERVDFRKAKCSTEELFKDGGKKAYGAISLYRLMEIMCTKPRELFPIRGPRYIAEGEEADLAILDCEKIYQVDPAKFYSMGRSTLFSGMEVQGEVVKTFYEGKEIYDREKGFLED